MQNHLKNQTSPYLLQHAENPVNWYPWCEEAFEKARKEDKPIFLSIGYSTCHWCHVMAHESFEDREVAELLNQYFVSIKVDKEERPDIDSIYMSVCQAYTGSGGWPISIFMTPDQTPFFAGTYFPKKRNYGKMGFVELLKIVAEKWERDRTVLLEVSEEIIEVLKAEKTEKSDAIENYYEKTGHTDSDLLEDAIKLYKQSFDKEWGGFGEPPKFPAPHNLLFLMRRYEQSGEEDLLSMVEKTLLQMYYGGMFDHIGGGFSRYSTDRYFLVPHFEKMLYDNALLMMAYCKAYQITKKWIYCEIAEKIAEYVRREMMSEEGVFYSAQDADSEGEEGKFYTFTPTEIKKLLGETEGTEFNRYFNITEEGNFEGKSIPNLLYKDAIHKDMTREELEGHKKHVYEYRRNRYKLHLDDKVLVSWNALMIAAMCQLYRVTGHGTYLQVAVEAQSFINEKLWDGTHLCVSFRAGMCNGKGYLDDYAYEIFALLNLYEATLEREYLEQAQLFCKKVIEEFWDTESGGFFLYGNYHEQLILHPKENYDGAIFSGNSAMAYNLVRLYWITGAEDDKRKAEQQFEFMKNEVKTYSVGYAMFLTALMDYLEPPEMITIVTKNKVEVQEVPCKVSLSTVFRILEEETAEYRMKDGKTTYYICGNGSCLPPRNEL